MNPEHKPARFRWLDLAATDAARAARFYEGLFGWQAERRRANGGELFQLTHEGESIASLYQLRPRHIDSGVPSHWTPYVGVAGMDEAVRKAEALGGQVVVNPFHVDGMARIGLVADPVGALFGLWELPR